MANLLLKMSPQFWIVGTLLVSAIHLALYVPSAWITSQHQLVRRTVALVLAVLVATYVAAMLPNLELEGLFFRNRLALHFQAHLAIATVIWIGAALIIWRRKAT